VDLATRSAALSRRSSRAASRRWRRRPRRSGCTAAPARSSRLGGALLIGGVAHGIKNVVLRTLIHERVAEHRRGRAFASYNALRNGAELGALSAGGVLVGIAGAQAALALSGAIPLAIGVAALALLARHPAPATSIRLRSRPTTT
jgi:hypothetical protein